MTSRSATVVTIIVTVVLLAACGAAVFNRIRSTSTQAFPAETASNTPKALQAVETAFNANDFTSAIAQADALLAHDPNDIVALLAKAETLAQRGSIEFKEQVYGPQAISLAQQVLARDPQNATAWRIIGYAYEIMQNYPQAHDAYARSLTLDPENPLTLSQEAHTYDLEGELAKAEAGYRKALARDPKLLSATLGLARILGAKGKLADAAQMFDIVARTSPNIRTQAEGYYSEGQAIGLLGLESLSYTLMASSTIADPTYALGWYGRGVEAFALARATSSTLTDSARVTLVGESFDDLLKAVQINPNQSAAHYQLGLELALTGQRSKAQKVLTEAKAIVPGDITLNAPDKKAVLDNINAALDVLAASPVLSKPAL